MGIKLEQQKLEIERCRKAHEVNCATVSPLAVVITTIAIIAATALPSCDGDISTPLLEKRGYIDIHIERSSTEYLLHKILRFQDFDNADDDADDDDDDADDGGLSRHVCLLVAGACSADDSPVFLDTTIESMLSGASGGGTSDSRDEAMVSGAGLERQRVDSAYGCRQGAFRVQREGRDGSAAEPG